MMMNVFVLVHLTNNIYINKNAKNYILNIKYYIASESRENNTKIFCYNDCPIEYQFSVKEDNENDICKGLCPECCIKIIDPNIIVQRMH